MRAAWVVAFAGTVLLSGPSHAQEAAARDVRCFLGSSTFSVGAAMDIGDTVAICDAAGSWAPSEAKVSAAGCLLEGKLSSVGASVGVRNSDGVQQCDASGQWMMVEAAPQG